jgi:hypothetical protein
MVESISTFGDSGQLTFSGYTLHPVIRMAMTSIAKKSIPRFLISFNIYLPVHP